MVSPDIVVTVPRLSSAVPHLHETHAALQQTPGDQHLPGLQAFAVHLADVLGLLRKIKCFVGFHLHAKGKFERLSARFEQCVLFAPLLRIQELLGQFGALFLLIGCLGLLE